MRYLAILIGMIAALSIGSVTAQESETQPEVGGKTVVEAEEPTIEEPTIGVDSPDSNIPDFLTKMTPPQAWHFAAGGIATALTSVGLRWIPLPKNPDKRSDARTVVAFGSSLVVGVGGAALNGELVNWQPSLTGVIYILGTALLLYEKVPYIKASVRKLEGAKGKRLRAKEAAG